MKKQRLLFLIFCVVTFSLQAASYDFELIQEGKVADLCLTSSADPLAKVGEMYLQDLKAVTQQDAQLLNETQTAKCKGNVVIAGVPGTSVFLDKMLDKLKIDVSFLKNAPEAFRIQTVRRGGKKRLLVLGADPLGVAYGLLEISRRAGVSPWIWWADAKPRPCNSLIFPSDFVFQDKPAVRYRGIFINDEDFSLMPWATKVLDPASAKGAIGPAAYEKICQLLLRLRANALWPAMHECTAAFYTVPGNAAVAKAYGIYLGTSHCEPLMRNNVGEWEEKSMGPFDYTQNATRVQQYWVERVQQTAGTPCIYTVGMRGVHDGSMQGASTLLEQKNLLERVFEDQRKLLSKGLKQHADQIPQVFIPYKEVLSVYDAGLKVPDDVTLMWCDDNYGYLTRASNAAEQQRSGGSGVYYHLSYWGRPHDYLWLASTSPAQIQLEMTRAWEKQATKIWIVNVGDIKPAEYLTEFYLDLAWNIGKPSALPVASQSAPVWTDHLLAFFQREFGTDYAREMTQIMQGYYQLANQRKPEFMGWSRVEEPRFPNGKSPVSDTEFSIKEAEDRIQEYSELETRVRNLYGRLDPAARDAFFELVLYPVAGASLLNQKLLCAQLSRQAEATRRYDEATRFAAAAILAYNGIQALTQKYQTEAGGGKWAGFMNDHPRNLAVFGPPVLPERLKNTPPAAYRWGLYVKHQLYIGDLPEEKNGCVAFPASATSSVVASAAGRPSGLGHSGTAIRLRRGETLEYRFSTRSKGLAELSVYTLPLQPLEGRSLCYKLVLDDELPVVVNTATKGRSEAWKQRVLRNQSVMRLKINVRKSGVHTLRLTALDDDVVADQFLLDFQSGRKCYLVPIQ